jgi:hypothetical protein
MLSAMRQLAKSVRSIFTPDSNVISMFDGKPASIGFISTRVFDASSRTVNPHPSPVISREVGDAAATEPTNEKENSSLPSRPFILVGPFRHVFISLPNISVDEGMFVGLAQDYGLEEAINKAEYFHLDYRRALETLQQAMRETASRSLMATKL